MNISVVIPVFNEGKRLKECLTAICSNTKKPFEVIVSDGGSCDDTVAIAKSFPGVKVIHNKRKNAAAGRNEGIKIAKGEIIAFTDGDCIVAKDWIESIERYFLENDIDGIGGKVLNARPENKYEEYWGNLAWNLIMNFGDEAYEVTEKKLNDAFVTANCAYRRKLLVKVKGFNNWFANNAEDVDLCWRTIDSGAKLMYAPEVVIYAHNVTTLKGIAKKSFRNGLSSSELQKKYGGKINFDPNIYKMLGKNIKGVFKKEKDAGLNVVELSAHLLGKYYGSIKVGVINF